MQKPRLGSQKYLKFTHLYTQYKSLNQSVMSVITNTHKKKIEADKKK